MDHRPENEISTPLRFTVNLDTFDDRCVTIRERDSANRIHVRTDNLVDELRAHSLDKVRQVEYTLSLRDWKLWDAGVGVGTNSDSATALHLSWRSTFAESLIASSLVPFGPPAPGRTGLLY